MKFIILTCLIILGNITLCLETADQNISANLPQVLELEKVIVEAKEYDDQDFMPNMDIKSINKVDNTKYVIELSPVSVRVRTNLITPIIVNAEFTSLEHATKSYSLKTNKLSISPTSYTLNNPYNHIETENFIPYIVVTSDVPIGLYNGILTFSVGAL